LSDLRRNSTRAVRQEDGAIAKQTDRPVERVTSDRGRAAEHEERTPKHPAVPPLLLLHRDTRRQDRAHPNHPQPNTIQRRALVRCSRTMCVRLGFLQKVTASRDTLGAGLFVPLVERIHSGWAHLRTDNTDLLILATTCTWGSTISATS
jgi:hypothetical protein